jgi:UDP-3-O-[3-hydroxymyristoyl] N-acetylglucosamine deacetylase
MSPPTKEIQLEGAGLHTGAQARVTLRVAAGPTRLRVGALEARIDELEVVSTARATTVSACGGRLRAGTVEHAFAALAGLGLYEGVTLELDGPELPLLDGCATAWCAALTRLHVAPHRPPLHVTRAAVLEVGPSCYEFAPSAAIDVTARIEFDDPRLDPEACWQGDAADFVDRIAPARTFALAHEVDELARRGLARHVDPTSVVILTPDAILHAGRPFTPDEPARHKLLDLIGDLFLHGGPPIGHLHATRPGHAANARAIRRALDEGVLARG